MADYLLRAPDEDMARWKAEAALRGQPFASFIRKALDQATSSQARRQAVARLVEATRQVEPDPK